MRTAFSMARQQQETDFLAAAGLDTTFSAKSTNGRTLNPRLTQRRPAAPPLGAENVIKSKPIEDLEYAEDSTDSEDSADLSEDARNRRDVKRSVRLKVKLDWEEAKKQENERRERGSMPVAEGLSSNPRAHMLHTGKWTKKEYTLGRAVALTGIWSCCGDSAALSLYCPNQFAREDMAQLMQAASLRRQEQIAYKKLKYENVKLLWDRHELGAAPEEHKAAEDIAMEYAGSVESSFNAPMLMSWLYKNHKEEPTVLTGMGFLLHHLEKAEGCALMLKHGAIGTLKHIHLHYREHPPLQLQCVTALGRLLECNITRDDVIANTEALRMAFNIAHVHMNSRAHVDTAARCIAQCCRSEVCRRDILHRKVYAYMLNFCKRFSSTASILRSCLKLFNWVATTRERIVEICDAGVVKMILIVMKKHMTDADVISPAMLFLTRASEQYSTALDIVLKKRAVSTIIMALKALYSDEILQLAGLKMLQTLSKTTEGWRQISETRGGWQSICQGTALGDSLVHDLQGALFNPGWAIGDTPHLQVTDRIKILNAKAMQVRLGAVPKAAWTAHALRDYMGVAMKQTKLAVNNEYHDMYFELLSTIELLPGSSEEREQWFKRLKDYEAENDIRLEEMTNTMLELRHKEHLDLKRAEKSGLEDKTNNGKDIFVNGKRITSQLLSTSELTLEEMMRGDRSRDD